MTKRTRRIATGLGIAGLLFVAVRSIALIPEIHDSLCRQMTDQVVRDSTAGVVFFLVMGASPNRSVHGNMPAIHAAGALNRVRILKLLLAVGADPNLKTKFEETPLWSAQHMKADDTSRILVAAGGRAYISPDAP